MAKIYQNIQNLPLYLPFFSSDDIRIKIIEVAMSKLILGHDTMGLMHTSKILF